MKKWLTKIIVLSLILSFNLAGISFAALPGSVSIAEGVEAKQGQTVEIPIMLSGEYLPIAAAELIFSLDPDLTFIDVYTEGGIDDRSPGINKDFNIVFLESGSGEYSGDLLCKILVEVSPNASPGRKTIAFDPASNISCLKPPFAINFNFTEGSVIVPAPKVFIASGITASAGQTVKVPVAASEPISSIYMVQLMLDMSPGLTLSGVDTTGGIDDADPSITDRMILLTSESDGYTGTHICTLLISVDYGITLGKKTIAFGPGSIITTLYPSPREIDAEFAEGGLLVLDDVSALHIVTFVDWDGSVLSSQKILSGTSAFSPQDPEKEGYIFTGWDKSFDSVTQDLVVTALYTAKTYTVTFKDINGNNLKSEIVEHGKAAAAPIPPEFVGYKFTGWDKSFDSVTQDLVVTALYAAKTYTVTFKDINGNNIKSEMVNHGKPATAPIPPEFTGFEFTGWDKRFDSVTSNMVIYAQYINKAILNEIDEIKNINNVDEILDGLADIFGKIDTVYDDLIKKLNELEEKIKSLEEEIKQLKARIDNSQAPAAFSKEGSIKASGLLFNIGDGTEITLKFLETNQKIISKDDINGMYNQESAVLVDIKLEIDGVESSGKLKVPIVLTMPIPESISADDFWILHYNEDGSVSESIKPIINNDGTCSFTVTSFSVYAFVNGESGSITPGDINNDGRIDAADLSYLKRNLARISGFETNPAMFINNDKKIDALDLTYLKQFLLGKTGFEL
ncbi:MAG: InlB B-repeat-containing protein [Eubacterium sp.]|nr:InlB B-repeat-containing protein [Eubacterium sp.]